jgi:hypothetical protein
MCSVYDFFVLQILTLLDLQTAIAGDTRLESKQN